MSVTVVGVPEGSVTFADFNEFANAITAAFINLQGTLEPQQFESVISTVSADTTYSGPRLAVDTSGGSITITLPDAAAWLTSKANSSAAVAFIKKDSLDTNVVRIVPSGSDTIEGNVLYTLSTLNDAVALLPDSSGNNWHILTESEGPEIAAALARTLSLTQDLNGTSNPVISANTIIPGSTQVNTGGGNVTATLPAVGTFVRGQLTVTKVTGDANNVNVAPAAGDTINGGGATVSASAFASITLIPNALTSGDWVIVNQVGTWA